MQISAKIFLLFLFLSLTACTGDPYVMQAQAEALSGAAASAIQATQAAQYERAHAATIQAAQRQNEQQATSFAQNLLATQTSQAFDLGERMATATQQTIQLQATQAAAYIQATSEAQARQYNHQSTVMSAQATQTAISLETERLVRKAEQEALGIIFWSQFTRTAWVVGLLIFTYIIGANLKHWIDRYYEWQDRKHRLIETRQGTVAFVWDAEREEEIPILVVDLSNGARYNRSRPLLDAPTQVAATQVRSITPSGSVLESPVQRGETTERLVIRLLSASAEVVGQNSDQIPGWRKLKQSGFNSDKWQRAVSALVQARVVYTEQGSGTFIDKSRFSCVVELLEAVQTREVKIRPAPLDSSSID